MSGGPYVLVVCGLAFEARIARGSRRRASASRICCGMLRDLLAAPIETDCAGILSFGIAGGLDPALKPGTLVVASAIIGPDRVWPTDEAWSRRLLGRSTGAIYGKIVATDAPLQTVAAKQNCFRRTGAHAVDMESHIAARFAAGRSLPFAALRAIADPAGRAVPDFALGGMRPDGRLAPLPVLQALLRKPWELPAVLSLAGDVFRAARVLSGAFRTPGAGFGLDLG